MEENKYFTAHVSKMGKNLIISIPYKMKDIFTHNSQVKVELLNKEQGGQ